MLKIAKNLILLFSILFITDRILGIFVDKLFYKQKHGDDYVTIQLLDSTKADILILGSSRASHHYIPDSITAKTHLSCYNGGRDNMGIHYVYACVNQIVKRYTPKAIIIDIIPYAFLNGSQNTDTYFDTQTSALLPFAKQHTSIYEVIHTFKPNDVLKAKWIKMYAYNSLIGTIFQNAFTKLGHTQVNGYEPLMDSLVKENNLIQTHVVPNENVGIDTNAFLILNKTLDICKQRNIKVILCFSPFYFQHVLYKTVENKFKEIATLQNATLLDYTKDTFFIKNANVFYDEMHLNNTGAILLSNKICNEALLKK